MTKPDIFAKISFKNLSRVALYLSDKLLREYAKSNAWFLFYDLGAEHLTLSLAVWKALCELKEFGQLRTRPEDLIRRAKSNMRAYACRGYPTMLIHLCRAFSRQFADFDNLPEKNFEYNFSDWAFYDYADYPCAKQSDQAAHKIFAEEISSLEKFGKYIVCERQPEEFTEIAGVGGFIVSKWRYSIVVPFETKGEAALFIAQLVDLLRTKGEPDCPEAAQFIRDTVAQAPVEAMRIQLEKEAAKREEEQAAIARAKREESMRQGVHVYVLELDNDTVKIGISNNVRRRINEVEQGGLDVTRFALTQRGFNQSEAHRIEKACHEFFDDRRKRGEYFRISYEEAIAHLQTYTPVIEPDDSD